MRTRLDDGVARRRAKSQPVEIEERVAVDEEEVFVEPVGRQRQGAGGAGRARFDHRLDAHAANGASVVDGVRSPARYPHSSRARLMP